MTHNISRTLVHWLILTFLAFGAIGASASEVTGTLSSDGSNQPTTGSAQQESTEATIMNVKGEQTLSGTVVSGVDSEQDNAAVFTLLLWALPLALLAAVVLGLNWRRKSV